MDQEIFNFSVTVREVIANVLVATLCGSFISLFYSLTQRRMNRSVILIKSIIVLCMITAFVMMVIGDNLARAFGMVGLISLIRFRTSFKGAQDFIFIYFALAIGIAAGVGLYAVALAGTLLIGIITVILNELKATNRQEPEFILQIISASSSNAGQCYEGTLKKFCSKYKLAGTKANFNENETLTRLSYNVSLRNSEDGRNLLKELYMVGGVKELSLQHQEE